MLVLFRATVIVVTIFLAGCATTRPKCNPKEANRVVRPGETFDPLCHDMKFFPPGTSFMEALETGLIVPMWNGRNIVIVWGKNLKPFNP